MPSPSTEETVAASALVVLIVGLIFFWPASAMSAAASAPLVRVEMTEFRFRPSTIRLSAGIRVTMELVNQGQIAHQLDAPFLRHTPVTVVDNITHIEAPGLDIVRVQPGARARVTFLPPTRGRFRFICSIEGHAEAGMVGLVDVR